MGPSLTKFASNLGVEIDTLDNNTTWKERHAQRRGCEVDKEREWYDIITNSIGDDYNRLRFLEGSGILGRAWLDAIPYNKAETLSDQLDTT